MRSPVRYREPEWAVDANAPPTIRALRLQHPTGRYADVPRLPVSTALTLSAVAGLIGLCVALDERAPAKSPARLADAISISAPTTQPVLTAEMTTTAGTLTPADAAVKPPMMLAATTAPEPSPGTPAPSVEAPTVAPEVTAALTECAGLLGGLKLDFEQLAPLIDTTCFAPAPIRLRSVGAARTELVPPAVVNCRIAAAVHSWTETVLQPAARSHLGTSVKRISGVQGHACRNRNNAKSGPISEHAFANAIDVTELHLADGRVVSVAKDWGPVARDAPAVQPVVRAQALVAVKTAAAGSAATVGPAAPTPASRFLRQIHAGACTTFGTVLGPEANDAHRDHLHFDLKPRGRKVLCE